MGKIDYNKFSGKPVTNAEPEQVNNEKNETKAETVNVNDINVNEVEPAKATNVEPEITETEPEVLDTELLTTGVVAKCSHLNIRKMPNLNSAVLCVVAAGTKVSMDTKESTNAWYKVFLDNGNCGYCMKNYITIE